MIGSFSEDTPNRCSADIQPSLDLRFADSCAVEVLDLGGLLCRSCGATQAGSVQPCLGQSGANTFAEDCVLNSAKTESTHGKNSRWIVTLAS